MSMQACFPSMNPLGMAFAARISYLPKDAYVREVEAHRVVFYRQTGVRALLEAGLGARTAGGTPGRQFCWGIPAGRYGSLPGHHCSATAPALNGRQVCQTEKGTEGIFSTNLQKCYRPHICVWRHFSSAMCSEQLNRSNVPGVWNPSMWNLPFFHDLEWCSGQSWDWCSLGWSSVWSAAPYRVVQQYGTCLSWFLKHWGVSFHSSWPFGPAQLYGPLK